MGMIGAELFHILVSLGERLTEQEADDIMKDCGVEENEDGEIPYSPFLKKLWPDITRNKFNYLLFSPYPYKKNLVQNKKNNSFLEETSSRTLPRRRVKRLQPAQMFLINSCQMK